MDARMTLGINISIILTLTIFTGFLLLPLKMLLDTNYDKQVDNNETNNFIENTQVEIQYKSLKLCPGDYKYWLKSISQSNYDGNCTYKSNSKETIIMNKIPENNKEKNSIEKIKESTTNFLSGGFRVIKSKSVPVTDHILALMLIVSVIGALVEILRIRFGNPQQVFAYDN